MDREPIFGARDDGDPIDGAAIIQGLYSGLRPRARPSVDARGRGSPPTISGVYGELTPRGVGLLLARVPIGPADVFVDLGSGFGKVVLQVGIAARPARAIGVEVEPARHATAVLARDRAVACGAVADGRCVFRNEDVRATDLSDATVLFANAVCFSAPLLRAVIARIAALPRPVTLVSLHTRKRLPPFLAHVESCDCETSWSSRERMHVYRFTPS